MSHISGGIIDPPSVFIVVIPTIGTLLIEVKGAFLSSFYAIWQIDTWQCCCFWKACEKCVIVCDYLGFITGLVSALGELDDLVSIGPAVTIALLTVFYGLFWGYLIAELVVSLWETKKRKMETS